LRSLPNGDAFLYFLLAVTCMTDVGALYGGKLLGRKPLAPVLSPNKTWEGAAAGLLSALIFIWVSAYVDVQFSGEALWIENRPWLLELTLLTILVSSAGQVGDLCESALKRDLGIKDSGDTITGHGGYLDMMDGALWIAPATLIYALFFT
jgi:phosphatidate cytidylyltransferase